MPLVEIVREVPIPEVERTLRGVPLVSDEKRLPYNNARIELRDVWHGEVNPIAFYVTQGQLDFQRQLYEDLKKQGYNTLHLHCGLETRNAKGESWLLTPPVVEIDHDEVIFMNKAGDIDYSNRPTRVKLPILVDGLHRFMLARDFKESVSSLTISGVPEDMPVGALPNAWEEIQVYTDIPKTVGEKKLYRTKVSYQYYRDFDRFGMGRRRITGKGEVGQ